jgi:acyl carrier protein
MNDSEIFQKVVTMIKPFAKNQAALAAANPETKILDDLKVNSARLVDIILEIENTFDIELADEDADQVSTLGDAVRVIKAKQT